MKTETLWLIVFVATTCWIMGWFDGRKTGREEAGRSHSANMNRLIEDGWTILDGEGKEIQRWDE